uniref:Uncharacterized protein n=1 Tax=viral metagenome TaxID=1070528 RepID=A0A6M3LPM7_9ZZZZ
MTSEVWGCRYCSGMGYEDFPSNRVPCRIEEHLGLAKSDHDLAKAYLDTVRRDAAVNEVCPYCRKTGNCEHYGGLGWSRDGATHHKVNGRWVRK